MKYEVKTKFVFTGAFTNEAESREQAKEFVEKHCGFVIGGNIHTTLYEDDCDWDFLTHPKKVIGRTRKIA